MAGKLVYSGKDDFQVLLARFKRMRESIQHDLGCSHVAAARLAIPEFNLDLKARSLSKHFDPHSRSLNAVEGEG